jgi:hypothetical protein
VCLWHSRVQLFREEVLSAPIHSPLSCHPKRSFNILYSCNLKVLGVDSNAFRSLMPGPREVVVLDPNSNECKDKLLVHLRYDWIGTKPRVAMCVDVR